MKLIIDEKLKKEKWNQKDKISAIYIITNLVNNKKYVGQTSNVRKRFSDYNGTKYLDQKTPIYRAIKKYGQDNFTFEVIQCPKLKLDMMEMEYISDLKTTDIKYGYNILKGANGATRLDSVRKKLSVVHTGMKESNDTKRKKSNMIIMINDKENYMVVADSAKLIGDYLGKSKDYIKNCLRQPSRVGNYRLYYDDMEKRTAILEKMYNKKSIRDTKYVEYGEYLNTVELESVETMYDSLRAKFGDIYTLSYDDESLSLKEYIPLETEVTEEEIERAYMEFIEEEFESKDL